MRPRLTLRWMDRSGGARQRCDWREARRVGRVPGWSLRPGRSRCNTLYRRLRSYAATGSGTHVLQNLDGLLETSHAIPRRIDFPVPEFRVRLQILALVTRCGDDASMRIVAASTAGLRCIVSTDQPPGKKRRGCHGYSIATETVEGAIPQGSQRLEDHSAGKGGQTDAPISCSVDIGRAIYNAEAHQGVGGAGSGACSGDFLLGALAACAQITCQMVAAAMEIKTDRIEVTIEGDLDLRGTLGISKEVPVGFENIRLHFDVAAPKATPGTDGRVARENRTVLRGDANIDAAAESSNRVGCSGLNLSGSSRIRCSDLCAQTALSRKGQRDQPCCGGFCNHLRGQSPMERDIRWRPFRSHQERPLLRPPAFRVPARFFFFFAGTFLSGLRGVDFICIAMGCLGS